jgi:predicted ester cyclase
MPGSPSLVSGDADLETWKRFSTAMVDSVPDTRHPVSNVIEAGDQLVVEFRWQGTHTRPLFSPQGEIPATGKQLDVRISAVFEIEAGRITAERGYFDQVEFLTQLGLIRAPVSA